METLQGVLATASLPPCWPCQNHEVADKRITQWSGFANAACGEKVLRQPRRHKGRAYPLAMKRSMDVPQRRGPDEHRFVEHMDDVLAQAKSTS